MTGLLLICRSVTYAQRARKLLESGGITAIIVRPGINITGQSCNYAVKISQSYLPEAVEILKDSGIPLIKVILVEENGRARELSF